MLLTSKPVLCNYYVTYRCNAKCSFCDIWEKPSPLIKIENVKKNLIDLKKLGVKVIDFTGGEPLLHNKIEQLLKLAKSMGFITTLTTNCLLYPKWAEKIKGLVDMLHFSLDYANQKDHDQSRGVSCFDFVMKSIKIARELDERPDILFTVFEKNHEQIKMVYNEICLPNDLLMILNPAFEYNEVNVGPLLSSATYDKLEKWGSMRKIYLNRAFLELARNGGNQIEDPVCKAGTSTVVISPENNLVMPCYHLGLKEFPIEDNLFEVWNSGEVMEIKKLEGKVPQCQGCTINCYMQPSFSVNMNKYWFYALPSTLKYNLIKGTWKQLLIA